MTLKKLEKLCKLVRYFIIKTSSAAGSGHPTSSLSAVELLVTLMFGGFFQADLSNPKNPYNDRLIFSKGHATPLLYSLYAVAGNISQEDLLTFRKINSIYEGHPSMRFAYTEAPTGSLGQGLGLGVGIAMSSKLDQRSFNTYVLLGDSEVVEGSVWEAASLASFYKLNNLIAILDVNRLGQTGETMFSHYLNNYERKFQAFGWETFLVDGHDINNIEEAFNSINKSTSTLPKIIIAKTLKGKGVKFAENKNDWHGKAFIGDFESRALLDIGQVDTGIQGEIKKPKTLQYKEFTSKPINIQTKYELDEKIATRDAYGKFLEEVGDLNPNIVVLDAETSNSTKADKFKKYGERFIESYIAEQNMVSMALGLSTRGKIPFVSTFSAFFTRAYDQIRMSQYANSNIKFVGSHAGVSIGEDGFSQMGLEDLAMFRSIQDITIYYPSDAQSTIKLLELSTNDYGNHYIRITRGKTNVIYKKDTVFEKGGSNTLYHSKNDQITILSAGITLHEAIKAVEVLKKQSFRIRLIDLYSIKPLDQVAIVKADIETKAIIVVEDHYQEGGIYEAVCASGKVSLDNVYSLSVKKRPRSGKPEELLNYVGIDSKSIIKKVKEVISDMKL